MRKKSIIFLVMSLLILTFSSSALAVVANSEFKSESQKFFTITEYELFKQIQDQSDEQLANQGNTDEQIQKIREFDYIKELQKRATMSDTDLEKLGYEPERINKLRSFDGSEEQAIALSATLTLTCNISQHFYNGSQTVAKVNYNWNWSSMPVWTLTDAIAIVWDPSMYQTPNNPNDKQTISLYQGSNYIRKVTYSITPASPGHAAICRFPMLYDEWNNYWSKSASGVVYLGSTSQISDFAVRVSYAHTVVAGSPSVSFPGGLSISFGINTVEEDYDYDYSSL